MAKSPETEHSDAGTHAAKPAQLRRHLDPASLGFTTTADIEPLTGLVGQERALAAIEFGTGIAQEAFHLFVLGPPGAGKTSAVRSFLESRASAKAPPDDWIYVNNFAAAHRPQAICLPRGRAAGLARAMVSAIDELRTALPAVFEGEEYQGRRQAIDDEAQQWQENAFSELNKRAQEAGIALLRTATGFAMAPARDGKVVKPEDFKTLPQKEQDEVQAAIETLQAELGDILKQLPRIDKDRRRRVRELDEELATVAVGAVLADVEEEFADLDAVASHLKNVRKDMVAHLAAFSGDDSEPADSRAQPADSEKDARYRRYMVNVMIGDGGLDHAPIVESDNPTLGNLVGRIEHLSQMGALVTDFLLIKPGALHQANGGFLLLDTAKVLQQPFAWEALKRALRSRTIAIESPAAQAGMASTISLQPDRMPLDIKIVLFGDRRLYYALSAADPEFAGLFKVAADFNDTMDHSPQNAALFARLLASIVKRRGLRAIDAGGVARLIDESARMAGDSQKLTLRVEPTADLLCEADYWAGAASRDTITADDVARATREQIHRLDRLRDMTQESILRDIMLVDTSGEEVGQVNALSVMSVGSFAFGRPSRITARVRMGTGRLIDIEREVELGGPLHSKGVLILRGFLEGRYAHDAPLSLSASLVFEQSYGGIDGDSASAAELFALLSALAGAPLKQSLAVTGSVNQRGRMQAIGGVNEKIEGFFDICSSRGLTGEQGVIIPRSNLVHLMLREDVVEAAGRDAFHIYAISTIDEGIEILTGLPAGERDPQKVFTDGSINRLVEDRLIAFAASRRRFDAHGRDNDRPEMS